jgi:hypothetical protein
VCRPGREARQGQVGQIGGRHSCGSRSVAHSPRSVAPKGGRGEIR